MPVATAGYAMADADAVVALVDSFRVAVATAGHALESLHAQLAAFLREAGCRDVYLDVGSNIGVTVRKLFEPAKYPGAPVHAVFDSCFGPTPRCSVCAVGFEPNPNHSERLHALQQRMRRLGWPVLILPAAAGARDGALQFGVKSGFVNDIAATAFAARAGRWVTVPMLDLARVLWLVGNHTSPHARCRGRPAERCRWGRVAMKLDIEGLEREVVPRLMAPSGFSICAVDRLFLEWHDDNRAVRFTDKQRLQLQRLHEWSATLNFSRLQPGCRVSLLDLDDETYLHDTDRSGRQVPGTVAAARGANVPHPAAALNE